MSFILLRTALVSSCLIFLSVSRRKQQFIDQEFSELLQSRNRRAIKPLTAMLFAHQPQRIPSNSMARRTVAATRNRRGRKIYAIESPDPMEAKYGRIPTPLFEKITQAKERLFGERDPETLASRALLAEKQFNRGDPPARRAALSLARSALGDRAKVLGEDDPATQASKIKVAVMLEESGNTERAAELTRESFAWWKNNTEIESFKIYCGLDLSRMLFKIGNVTEAEELLREVVAVQDMELGWKNPDTMESKQELMSILIARGELDEAEEMGLNILKNLDDGMQSTLSAGIMKELAKIVEARGDSEKAEKMRKDAMSSEASARFFSDYSTQSEGSDFDEGDIEVPSHLKIDLDEDGKPVQLRYVYVDEVECIGCTFCASTAKSTFAMVPETGKARTFTQGRDDPLVVAEAIDTCPVNCIAYVDLDDLIVLENERESQFIDPMAMAMRGVGQATGGTVSRAKFGSSGAMCCNACPQKGCKDCPMYGVGLNPTYLERQEALQKKRAERAKASSLSFSIEGSEDILDNFLTAADDSSELFASKIDDVEATADDSSELFASKIDDLEATLNDRDENEALDDIEQEDAETEQNREDMLNALFSEEYSFEDTDDDERSGRL